jgi:hypothetical protein
MFLCAARRVVWFSVLGLLTVVLIGPVLSVVGTLLPFALIGAAVWLVWWGSERLARRFRLGSVRERLANAEVLPAVGRGAKRAVGEGIRQCKEWGPVVCERAWAAGKGAGAMVRDGIQKCEKAAPQMRARMGRFSETMSRAGRSAVRILVEVGCGASVGALVAWYALGTAEEIVALGALLGGALGFVVGGPKRQPAGELAAE